MLGIPKGRSRLPDTGAENGPNDATTFGESCRERRSKDVARSLDAAGVERERSAIVN
jgi:hypothetical protein